MQHFKIILLKSVGKIVFFFFSFFPLKKCVVFSNFNGKRYDDNPRYISEKLYLLDPTIEQVWLIHKGYSFFVPDYVELCEWPSLKMIYRLATSLIWVDSHSKPLYVSKRKGQFFIETWHGGLGLKKIEFDAEDVLSKYYLETSLHSTNMADVFVSNSKWLSSLYRRAFKYKGEILEYGFPKNDIFLNTNGFNYHKLVLSNLNISDNKKILLYAPTFREEYGFNDWMTIDFQKILRYLNSKYNENWVVLIKMHPKYIGKFSTSSYFGCSSNIIDVTNYPNTQELLLAADIFVTDYSSTIFDFSLTRKPAFIYASDYIQYKKKSRDLYFDLKSLPFQFSKNTSELIKSIKTFDQKSYERKLNVFNKTVGLIDDGFASERCANLIVKKCSDFKKL